MVLSKVATEDILTPIVLLLLVIVAKLALTLSSHAPFGLHHLVCVTLARLIALAGVVTLEVRRRVGSHAIVIANGMVARRTAHTSIWDLDVSALGRSQVRCLFVSSPPYPRPAAIGIDSRRPGMSVGNILPLLSRLSAARSTSGSQSQRQSMASSISSNGAEVEI